METGTVHFFSAEKGWGFIAGDNGERYFVHQTSINQEGFRSLDAEQRVSFDVEKSERGPKATNVTVIVESDDAGV